jgi:hypothetical protein
MIKLITDNDTYLIENSFLSKIPALERMVINETIIFTQNSDVIQGLILYLEDKTLDGMCVDSLLELYIFAQILDHDPLVEKCISIIKKIATVKDLYGISSYNWAWREHKKILSSLDVDEFIELIRLSNMTLNGLNNLIYAMSDKQHFLYYAIQYPDCKEWDKNIVKSALSKPSFYTERAILILREKADLPLSLVLKSSLKNVSMNVPKILTYKEMTLQPHIEDGKLYINSKPIVLLIKCEYIGQYDCGNYNCRGIHPVLKYTQAKEMETLIDNLKKYISGWKVSIGCKEMWLEWDSNSSRIVDRVNGKILSLTDISPKMECNAYVKITTGRYMEIVAYGLLLVVDTRTVNP